MASPAAAPRHTVAAHYFQFRLPGITAFGYNEWGVRFVNALAFALTVLLVHALAKSMNAGEENRESDKVRDQ